MRLALLIGAVSSIVRNGGYVRLGDGSWRVGADNLRGLGVKVVSSNEPPLSYSVGDIIPGNTIVRAEVVEKSETKHYFNVYAELVRGTTS